MTVYIDRTIRVDGTSNLNGVRGGFFDKVTVHPILDPFLWPEKAGHSTKAKVYREVLWQKEPESVP